MSKKDNIENKAAVSPSTATICSADGHGGNAKRQPPNLRQTDLIACCNTCEYAESDFKGNSWCEKYKSKLQPDFICDDYE